MTTQQSDPWSSAPGEVQNAQNNVQEGQDNGSAGFLNDVGLDKVEADPNYIADGQWPAFVYSSKVVTKKDATKHWVLTYKIAPNSPAHSGVQQDEWYAISNASESQKSYLKKRCLSLGVPENRINSFSPGDVVGLAVFINIYHRNGYQNVGDVTLRDESSGAPVSPQQGQQQGNGQPQQADVSSLM